MEVSFSQWNLRSIWQGMKNTAAVNYTTSSRKPIQGDGCNTTSLPNDLNSFFSRFKKDNSAELKTIISTLHPGDSTITFSREEVVRALKRTKSNTATGPDNICGRTLKHCAEQLGEVFQQLFQTSMNCSTVPRKCPTKVLNDLRPVALTSLVMKAMERIVKNSITKSVEPIDGPIAVHIQGWQGSGQRQDIHLGDHPQISGDPQHHCQALVCGLLFCIQYHAATHPCREVNNPVQFGSPAHHVDY
ncbi:hypothetical protein ABVT39_012814 [Epinephelus coioides]